MGPNGSIYANTVGTFGVDSAGRNGGCLSGAVRRWALKLVGGKSPTLFLSPPDTLFLSESDDFGEASLGIALLLTITVRPFSGSDSG